MNSMTQNKSLKNFYDSVYIKNEKKHYSNLLIMDDPLEMDNEILNVMNFKKKKILEIGCGTGNFAFKVAKLGGKILAVDYSDEAIKIAQKNYTHKNLEYKQLDVTKNFLGNYDTIVMVGTLEHMDNPLQVLKVCKKHLNKNGKIIVTVPNWLNPRGYILLSLYFLFNAPITLADIHYLSPVDFTKWSEKLNMKLHWKTLNRSWGYGDVMIKDLKRRLPKVFSDLGMKKDQNVQELIKWLKQNTLSFNNELPHSGAMGLYVFTKKS